MTSGVFISLDGLDGCGKTTQVRLLGDWLGAQEIAHTRCRDPGGTPVGDRIRGILLDAQCDRVMLCETFLFMASRAQLTEQVIRPALQRKEVVICDRFLLANVVYQGHAGGLLPQQIWEVGLMATRGLTPDLTLVLDLPVEVARSRRQGQADRIESRGEEYHARVRAGFLAEAERAPDRIKVIDGNRPVEVVHHDIRKEVALVLGTGSGT
jgi:dTMP kinase